MNSHEQRKVFLLLIFPFPLNSSRRGRGKKGNPRSINTRIQGVPIKLSDQVGILVLYGIHIIRLRISKLKGLKSIWITGFKLILCQMNVCYFFDFSFRPPLNYHRPCERVNMNFEQG